MNKQNRLPDSRQAAYRHRIEPLQIETYAAARFNLCRIEIFCILSHLLTAQVLVALYRRHGGGMRLWALRAKWSRRLPFAH